MALRRGLRRVSAVAGAAGGAARAAPLAAEGARGTTGFGIGTEIARSRRSEPDSAKVESSDRKISLRSKDHQTGNRQGEQTANNHTGRNALSQLKA